MWFGQIAADRISVKPVGECRHEVSRPLGIRVLATEGRGRRNAVFEL
jgi:hypothetical protein